MMSGDSNLTILEESCNSVTNPKRESDFDNVYLDSKKCKLSGCSSLETNTTEKLEEHGGSGGSLTNSLNLTEENGLNVGDLQPEVSIEGGHGNQKDEVLRDSNGTTKSFSQLASIDADAAEDKGSRHTMEDAWVVLPDASLGFRGKLRCAHFAIYDGHGGRLAAEYARNHLHANVLSAGLPRELMDIKAAKKAILEGFRRTDEALLQESAAAGWQDGATAVCVWILGQTVLVANIGDAKAILARSSSGDGLQKASDVPSCPLKAIVLTREHKVIYPQERARIQKAGGSVGSNGRLQGRLEVSRAFGDRQFKKVGVISAPDVQSFDLTEREHFIILGCDGLWGVFGPTDAVDFVGKHLKEGLSASTVSRRLVREAVRERRCKDNCTAIIIVFKHK